MDLLMKWFCFSHCGERLLSRKGDGNANKTKKIE
jgi:hypothetical protein